MSALVDIRRSLPSGKGISCKPFFFSQTHQGVKGFIVDSATNLPISNAELSVFSLGEGGIPVHMKHDITSTKIGEYWRILLPGKFIGGIKRFIECVNLICLTSI